MKWIRGQQMPSLPLRCIEATGFGQSTRRVHAVCTLPMPRQELHPVRRLARHGLRNNGPRPVASLRRGLGPGLPRINEGFQASLFFMGQWATIAHGLFYP